MKALYEHSGRAITPDDITQTLRSLGIVPGDTLLIHSRVSAFGKFLLFDRDAFFKEIEQAFLDAVGEEGTIVMPTFSYSFCNKEIFDMAKTPSTVGVLTEHFRKQSGVSRTKHPIFSVAISGRHRNEFLNIEKDSFDAQSIFGHLHRVNAKQVFFGASFESATFVHYIEQAHGVPYRYMKTLEGIIRENGKEYSDSATYNVRYLDKDVVTELARFEKHLVSIGAMKRAELGSGIIEVVSCEDAFREGMAMLDKDIYSFLHHPAQI